MKKPREVQRFCCFAAAAIMSAALFSLTVSAQIGAKPFLSGLNSPIFVTNAGDGTKRLFVVERGGTIKVVQPGTNAVSVFLDISAKIGSGGERGLLGLAFHPQYKTNRRFFVYYAATNGDIQISEFQTSANNADVADATEKSIISIPHPTNNNHYGGTLAFGADGYLYAGTGDGGAGNDPPNNAQNIDVLLGKFIRLNVDAGAPYTVPADNPFVGKAGADEIYALGVRNPFRWSFDRGGTHQLWAGDVGQGAIEEVDIINNGGNYGWRVFEGNRCTGNDSSLCNANNFTPPIFQYDHSNGRCSIIGGYVYRGTRGTLPDGAYTYGDYCTGEVFMWSGGQQSVLFDGANFNLASFGEDEDGELYIVRLGGTVDKLASLAPTAASVAIGGRVTTASGRGIRNLVVIMIDSSGSVRTATTTSFGYYHFADVAAGETYTVAVRGKNFSFSQPAQVLNVSDDMNNVNFAANQ